MNPRRRFWLEVFWRSILLLPPMYRPSPLVSPLRSMFSKMLSMRLFFTLLENPMPDWWSDDEPGLSCVNTPVFRFFCVRYTKLFRCRERALCIFVYLGPPVSGDDFFCLIAGSALDVFGRGACAGFAGLFYWLYVFDIFTVVSALTFCLFFKLFD